MNRILPLILVLLLASSSLFGQTPTVYNAKFLNGVAASDTETFCVDVMLSFDQAAKLGTSNLVFTYDNVNFNSPTIKSHILSAAYDTPSITTPVSGRASINIVLNFAPLAVDINVSDTKVFTICFSSLTPGMNTQLNWITDPGITPVFIEDNATQLASGPSMTNWNGAAPFPVEWLSFDAKQEGADAVLDWATASEINNNEFQIERSIDGQTFEMIGTRAGKGNTNGISNYTCVDRGASALGFRSLFYRLRQVDYDGSFEYSNTVELGIETDRSLSIVGYPNPFNQELTIRFSSIVKQDLHIEVISALGQRVFTHDTQDAEGDLSLDASNWAEGVYYLSIVGGSNREVYKILKE